jgi:segregation and condensation protein A
MDEKGLMQLITSECSWEQILNQVIAWEGLDPWNLDLKKLSEAFVQYLEKLEEMDFKVPAKYIIIAAILLRMKSDHLRFLEILESQQMPEVEEFDPIMLDETNGKSFEVNPISAPPKRFAKRRIVVDELVNALKKALQTHEKKTARRKRLTNKVQISQEDVTKRIANLYTRINGLLKKIKDEEVEFTKLVPKWERGDIVNTFLPLMHLENDKKVACRQDEMFEEIFIKRRQNVAQKGN